MNLLFFIVLIFAFQLLCLVAGKRAAKKIASSSDYFLANKSVKVFPLFMTFLATQVGGGLVLGSAEEAFQYGWIVFLYPLGAALGLIFLGLGLGRRLASFPVSTTAQIFEVSYGSKRLKQAASLLSIVSLFMILVAQIIASSKFLMSLGVSNQWLFIAFWGFCIFYTVQGGLRAVIATDVVQAAFFVIVFFVTLALAFFAKSSSLLQLADMSVYKGQFVFDLNKATGWLLMPLLFMVIEQDMGQRCFAAGSGKIVSKATFWSGIVTLAVCMVPIAFGMLGKTLGISIPKGASVLMEVVGKVTNPYLAAFMGCAVLAAIISTADSLINAISSNLSEDFMKKKEDNRKTIARIKAITFVLSLSSIFFSYFFTNIVDLMIQSYEFSVVALFVPTFIALFKRQGNFLSALLAILLGGAGFVIFRLFPVAFPREVLSLLLSLFGFGLGEVIVWARRRAVVFE